MRLTLVILLVVGTAAVLVSAQTQDKRRQARARFRALAEAARSGDRAAQDLLKSRRRQRPRQPRPQVEPTTFRPTTLFQATLAPQPDFTLLQETTFATEPTFTEAPVFNPVITSHSVAEKTISPARRRFRPQSRPIVQSQRPDDFNINFELEPHRALNTGLEVDTRSEHIIPRFGNGRTTEPPIETIRRYSYFDEQGNYVFGYETADGSFKEEIRGIDCVVNGKYGYVDPDGIRREFSYTSGNKCDPNAVVDPETQEVPVLPLNEQFLQQTQEQQLTETELSQLHFNRRRRPVQRTQTHEQNVVSENRHRRPVQSTQIQEQNIVSDNRRRRPSSRTSTRTRPAPRPVQEPKQVFHPVTEVPITATPAPAPIFTTPSSFNQFTTQGSPRQAQHQFPVRQPAPPRDPARKQITHQAFQPPEGPSFRPTPKPIAFDFDREFNHLFSNFGAPRPTTRAPAFIPRPTARPAPPPTSRPLPPISSRPLPPTSRPLPPTSRPLPPTAPPQVQPVPTTPGFSHPPIDDGSQTLSGRSDVANQLVFDAASGTFTNVKVNAGASNSFLPKPAPNPFAPRPSAPSPPLAPKRPTQSRFPLSPFTATKAPSPQPSRVGQPLPLPNNPPAPFNPASHFVINQNGRSPAASEFDKFFSQFNLNF